MYTVSIQTFDGERHLRGGLVRDDVIFKGTVLRTADFEVFDSFPILNDLTAPQHSGELCPLVFANM